MTFWEFLDQNQGWYFTLFAVFYFLINYVDGILEARRESKWEKIK